MMSIYEGPIAAFYFSELFRYHPSIHLVLQRAVPKQTEAQSVEIVLEVGAILFSRTRDSSPSFVNSLVKSQISLLSVFFS